MVIDAMAAITLEELLQEVGVHPEKLNESVSDDHLRAIAIFLTSWRKVATYLGLSENDLGDVEQEGKDEQDKRIKALQIWKGKFGFKATYRMLVDVLFQLAKADVAEKVLLLLKGMLYQLCDMTTVVRCHSPEKFKSLYQSATLRWSSTCTC